MEVGRYNQLCDRLNVLFNVINNRLYGIWVAPRSTMSIEELREREQWTPGDTMGDHDFYERPSKRELTLGRIIKLTENMTDVESELSFDRPNHTIPELYETIQEYLMIWVELINELPDITAPHIDELRTLENMARFLFGGYMKIKPYKDWVKQAQALKDAQSSTGPGLAGLAMLFSVPRYEQKNPGTDNTGLSFISHLDNLGKFGVYQRMRDEEVRTRAFLNQQAQPQPVQKETLLDDVSGGSTGEQMEPWYFNGGVN